MATHRAGERETAPSTLLFLLLLAACAGTTSKNPQAPQPDAGAVVYVLPSGDASRCVNTASPSGENASGTDPMCDPNAAPTSYARDIAPVLAGCSGEVCHAAWDYNTLVNQPSLACCDTRLLVAPYHPSLSLLTQALSGTNSCVGTMPLDSHLPAPEIQAIVAWVRQGALDN